MIFFHDSTSIYLAVYCKIKSQYQCSSGQCISKGAVCDNLVDCPDRDDEDGPCPGGKCEFI